MATIVTALSPISSKQIYEEIYYKQNDDNRDNDIPHDLKSKHKRSGYYTYNKSKHKYGYYCQKYLAECRTKIKSAIRINPNCPCSHAGSG